MLIKNILTRFLLLFLLKIWQLPENFSDCVKILFEKSSSEMSR